MEEQNKNAKRRERIKTFLIIFLALLLVLTFFSNTILNYSLPTVSAQYASYGTITERVRGSGIVMANQKYEVVAEGNRTVTSVSVKAGDEIKAGDPLFVLDASQNDEAVKEAESAIEEAELEYQKALLTAVPDYAKENQEIAAAREDLQIAIQRLNAAKNTSGKISDAAYKQATSDAQKAAERITELSGYLALAGSGETDGIPASYTRGMQAAKAAHDAAAETLEQAKADLEAKTTALTVTSAEQQAAIQELDRAAETAETAYARAKADYEADPQDITLQRAMEDAEQAARYAREDANAAAAALTDIQAQEAAIAQAQTAVNDAETAERNANKALNDAISGVTAAIQQDLDAANAQADAAAAVLDAYNQQGSSGGEMDITSLEDAVTQQERAVQTLLVTLAATQKADELTQQIDALDLQTKQAAIEKQKAELEELKQNAGTVTIKSKNAGIVSTVNAVTGDEVTDGMVLAEITLTDAGYTVQFSVTAEQARKVTIGSLADVTNGYYSDMTAKLVSAKANTEEPGSSGKILTFDITGNDVTVGEMLSLSINCSSNSYDCVVPSSSIMEDNDGKFVLVVRSKSTPLGNRYYVSRANVTVLASDETNSAVQGDVTYSDFVVTASEEPLTPGKQVRMED